MHYKGWHMLRIRMSFDWIRHFKKVRIPYALQRMTNVADPDEFWLDSTFQKSPDTLCVTKDDKCCGSGWVLTGFDFSKKSGYLMCHKGWQMLRTRTNFDWNRLFKKSPDTLCITKDDKCCGSGRVLTGTDFSKKSEYLMHYKGWRMLRILMSFDWIRHFKKVRIPYALQRMTNVADSGEFWLDPTFSKKSGYLLRYKGWQMSRIWTSFDWIGLFKKVRIPYALQRMTNVADPDEFWLDPTFQKLIMSPNLVIYSTQQFWRDLKHLNTQKV
jgi:hypothetical protein